MKEAVIVSTARPPIGRACRGAFNHTSGQQLAAHAVRNAVERTGVEPREVEDFILGCAMQHVVVTICVGDGMGAAGLFEVV